MKKTKYIVLLTLCLGQLVTAQELSVLTYNIKFDDPKDSLNSWEKRKSFLTGQLRFYAPDIFGTQEGLYHQLKDIAVALKNYMFIGVGRDFGDQRGEHTAIFYDPKNVKLLTHNTFWLSETPDKPSRGWDAALNRICTYGLFQRRKSGKKFMVFNTHFDHMGKKARTESARLILEKIRAINTKKLPVILMGDLNLEPDTESIRIITNLMEDTHVAAGENAFGPDGTFNGFHFNEPVTRKIDYIFISKGDFKVLKSAILSDAKNCRYPSDHFPVYTELRF